MVAPKDERVRVMLLRIYFALFKKLLKTDEKSIEEKKATEPKKDRSKSKKDNQIAAKKAK
jgi:hypothetical protein